MTFSETFYAADSSLATPVLQAWQENFPQMGVLLLIPEADSGNISPLQNFARTHNIRIFGAVFPALTTDQGIQTSGIVMIRFDLCPPWFITPLSSKHCEAGIAALVEATHDALDHKKPRTTEPLLFLIFDGILPNIGHYLHGIFTKLRTKVRYAGGNAGSETFQAIPCLFDRQQIYSEAVLCILLDRNTQVSVKHGYPVSKSLMKATSSTGNRIEEINGRPAFEAYQQIIKQEFGVNLTKDNFYDYAVHYPFGEIAALNILVRIPVRFDEHGAIICASEIPPHSMLRILQAPSLDKTTCLQEISDVLAPAPGTDKKAHVLALYCAGRRMHFGEEANQELRQLKTITQAQTLCGALTLGEIDTDRELGFPQFHNAAIVCLK